MSSEALAQQEVPIVVVDDFDVSDHSVTKIVSAYKKLSKVKDSILEEGIDKDYGVIPGTEKPTLLKPGAIALNQSFGVVSDDPEMVSEIIDNSKNPPFISYTFKTKLKSLRTNKILAVGFGVCNNYESKWRYRWLSVWKMTEEQKAIKDTVPKKWIAKGKGFFVFRFDNEDAYDQQETILQLAMKRSYVSATLYCIPGASKLYTLDMEDKDVPPPDKDMGDTEQSEPPQQSPDGGDGIVESSPPDSPGDVDAPQNDLPISTHTKKAITDYVKRKKLAPLVVTTFIASEFPPLTKLLQLSDEQGEKLLVLLKESNGE